MIGWENRPPTRDAPRIFCCVKVVLLGEIDHADPMVATATLDRLQHHGPVVPIPGHCCRLREERRAGALYDRLAERSRASLG